MEARPVLSTAEAERLGDEIAEISAHIDAATHRLLSLIRRFDASGGWADQGALSCAHWLCWRVGLDLGAARERVRVARALGELPAIDDALRLGRVSYSKVRALTRVATPESELSLLEMARSSTASQLERVCRGYRRACRGLLGDRPEDEVERRWVRERETDSGLVRFEVQVTPEEAAVVRKALELAMSRAWRGESAARSEVSAVSSARREKESVGGEQKSAGREQESLAREQSGCEQPPPSREYPASLQRVDGLVAIAESYLASPAEAERGRPPVEIVVHVDRGDAAGPDAVATLDDGTSLPCATLERLACDATVVRVVEDSRGNVLDVGLRRRTIPGALRRALGLRDRGCRFPGCTNRRVDGHHVVPWSHGGETKLANLASLCRRHHRFVHELGFRIEPDGAGGFAFFRPSGLRVEDTCSAPPIGAAPVEALCERHRADGIRIDAHTAYPRWDGTPADYDHIVMCLMSRHEIEADHGRAC